MRMGNSIKKILVLAANPLDTTRLSLDEEVRAIEQGLERSLKRDEFEIQAKFAVQPLDLQRAMLDIKPNFVHFSGHGSGIAGLTFKDNSGKSKIIGSKALAELFELFSETLECVVLNGCYSEFQAKEITKYIDHVIGMKWVISDKAAIDFAVGFYDALWAGEAIEFAYRFGCKAISLAGLQEENQPILLTRLSRGREFKLQEDLGERHRRSGRVFGVGDYRVAYVPASPRPWHMHYRELMPKQLNITVSSIKFELKAPYKNWPLSQTLDTNLLKCRLESVTEVAEGLELEFSPTYYEDYLRSGEQVELHQKDSGTSYHEWFLEKLTPASGYVVPFRELTNICGVGVFVLTRDHRLIVATQSEESHVYPGRLTFSASGTIPWGAAPDPYTTAILKAREEIHHLVEVSKLRLFAFGVDSRKLYFQFSFVERSNATAAQVLRFFELGGGEEGPENRPGSLNVFSFQNAEVVCELVVKNCWEPAAEAALLALAAHEFGESEVEAALRRRECDWWKRDLVDEWNHRASRPGLLPDMSVRYNQDQLKDISDQYLRFISQFIVEHIGGSSILEIGPGTGRISRLILDLNPDCLTCIELCHNMIARSIARLGEDAKSVIYRRGFAQDVLQKMIIDGDRYDIAVCSLVLIHNTVDREAESMIRSLSLISDRLLLFEDIRKRPTSPATKIRSERRLRQMLSPYFDIVGPSQKHDLAGDIILALHLASRKQEPSSCAT